MTLMMKEIGDQPDVLRKLLSHHFDRIKSLCATIKEKDIKFMYIAARGTSDHAAVYAKYVMETYAGIPVAFAAPSVITVYGGKPNLSDALVIGISQSGKAEDVIEVIRHANSLGAMTISITNYDESPLAMESDYHFSCLAGEEKSVAATKTFTAQMMIMAMIASELSEENGFIKGLFKIPDKLDEIIKTEGVIKKTAFDLKDIQECFVLSRGMNYAIALEGALKIQETCYVRAKAYAMSDFYHGPLALLDSNIPVFIIAPKGKMSKDTLEIMKIMKEHDIKTVAVTNDPEIAESATVVISIPDNTEEYASPFLSAAAMQVFACKLSLAKGLNPDNPRNIKKVTITR